MTERPSRRAWPAPLDPADIPAEAPVRYLKLPAPVRFTLAALTVAVAGLLALCVVLTVDSVQFQAYVEGRGQYRDAEADRLDDRINRVVCDILGEFPVGDERADRLRVRYGCPIPHPASDEEPRAEHSRRP